MPDTPETIIAARTVLDFCYRDSPKGYHVFYETQSDVEGDLQFRIWGDRPDLPKSAWGYLDANWIHGTLVPALGDRLNMESIEHPIWQAGAAIVFLKFIGKPGYIDATGPTFEAAMISAAAKAVRSA